MTSILAPAVAAAQPLPSGYAFNVSQYASGGYVVPGAYVDSDSPGSLSFGYCYVGSPSCVSGMTSAALGADPSISNSVSTTCDMAFPCTHPLDYSRVESIADTIVTYFVELSDPGKTAPEPVTLVGYDGLNAAQDSYAGYAYSIVGATDALKIQDYIGLGASGYEGYSFGSLADVKHVMLVPNSVYEVRMEVYTRAGGSSGDIAFAAIDPEFFVAPGSTGTLDYSPGVTSPTPEPASWALMLVGLGVAGGLLRRRQTLAL